MCADLNENQRDVGILWPSYELIRNCKHEANIAPGQISRLYTSIISFCFSISVKCGGEEWLTTHNSSNSIFIRDVLNIKFDEPLLILKEVAYEWILPIVITVGLIGNLLNLAVLSRPFLKGATKVYLTSLAITDLCVMLTAIPMIFRLSRHFFHKKTYITAFFHAHLELFLSLTFITASIFVVVSLTVDRYLAICLPKTFRNVHTTTNAKVIVLGAYMGSIIINFPIAFLKNVCLEKNNISGVNIWDYHENIDISRTGYFKIYLTLLELITRFTPICVVTVLNILIVRKFRNLAKIRRGLQPKAIFLLKDGTELSNEQTVHAKNKRMEEKRFITLLRATVGLYLVTMTPPAFLPFFYTEERESDFGLQLYRGLANILETANCALNFYVYCLCSRDFRVAFMKMFRCCRYKCVKNVKDCEENLEVEGKRSLS